MDLFVWIFLIVGFVFWLSGWGMSARFHRVPSVEPGAPKPRVRISVIVPARNEEANLGRLLESLRLQEFHPHEIIVVDDHSSDRTGEIARESGATVVEGEALPEGWYGKPWANTRGAKVATGDWLLFLDADTWLEPEGLLRIGYLAGDENIVHSVCPLHRVKRPFEQLSAFFNVIMLLGINAFTLRGQSARSIGLFGQTLLISRKAFDEAGGFHSVKRQVLENFHLSRELARKGFACRCYCGRGTVSMRMFPGGYREMEASWAKGIVSGAGNTPRSAVIGVSLWLSGLIMSSLSLCFLPRDTPAEFWATLGFYFLAAIQCLYLFKHAGTFWTIGALLFPIGLIYYQWLFFTAVARKKSGRSVQWKGRDVD